MNIISSKPVTLEEASEILETREKEGALEYEQQQSLEYLKKFAKKKEKESVKEIMKNKKVPLETAVKLADISPKMSNTVRAILVKDKLDLSEDEIAEIIKIIS